MIQYETDSSPFFVANKNYCETIESKLKTVNLECAGFCNCYGYDIETTWVKNNLTYTLKFHKHQSTQNGVVIPVDALDYAGAEVSVQGLNKKFNVTVGKSSVTRFFISKSLKNKISSPYFIKFNYSPSNNLIDNLVKEIQDNTISKLKLSNGTLVCKMHTPKVDPLELIRGIEKSTQNWV